MGSLRVALRADEGGQERLPSGTGRLLAGVAWLVLLLGLWLWGGRGPDGVPAGAAGPATGDMAAAGRPPVAGPVPPDRPVDGAAPRRLDIPGLGVRAPVVARGLDEDGALKPAGQAGAVAWYADGAAPGASGTALMAGEAGTWDGLAVGQMIRVVRVDGETVEFTVEDVRAAGLGGTGVLNGTEVPEETGTRNGTEVPEGTDAGGGLGLRGGSDVRERLDVQDGFDGRQVSALAGDGRAGLRLITCGGTAVRSSGACTAPVVVSAYPAGT